MNKTFTNINSCATPTLNTATPTPPFQKLT